jgi:hypothetical protein
VANVVKEILYNHKGTAMRYIGRVTHDTGTHLWFNTGGTHVYLEKGRILRQSLNTQRRGN